MLDRIFAAWIDEAMFTSELSILRTMRSMPNPRNFRGQWFKREILNEIARCLNLPYNIAACNSSGYNYASGRLDHQTYFKSIRVEQAHLAESVLAFAGIAPARALAVPKAQQFAEKLHARRPRR